METRIKAAVRMKGVMQCELAKAVGISNSMISHYIHGRSLPSAAVLIKMADYLGVSIDWLLGRDDDDKN